MSKATRKASAAIRAIRPDHPLWDEQVESIIDAAWAKRTETARGLRDAAFASDCTCDAAFCDHFNALTEALSAFATEWEE